MGRASKRQARAKQELAELSSGVPPDRPVEEEAQEGIQEEEEEDEVPATVKGAGAFALLNAGAEDADEAEGESGGDEEEAAESAAVKTKSKSKKKKKKKKPAGPTSTAASPDASESVSATPPGFSIGGEKQKKSGKGEADGGKDEDDGIDEIDRALRELGARTPAFPPPGASSSASGSSAGNNIKRLMAIDVKMLDADAELRRMFGSKVIASAPRSNPSRAGHARLANNPHHALNHRMTKSALAKPLASWPPYGAASGTSLSMTSLPSSVPGEQTFTFVHPPGFRAVQADFMQAVSTMDPNQIYSILSYAPYHPDSLLQLSDVSAHQGDLGQAADFLDRGLYSFERGFSGLFSSAMAKGEARLGFEKVENRGLFRALEKKVGNLAKRGCWRAACEFAKLLLALDPYTDPYGALLLLDFLAPKAKEYQWLLDLYAELPEVQDEDGLYVEAYPGLAYARALSLFHLEKSGEHRESTDALRSAILRFPMVLPPLSDKTGFALPAAFLRTPRSIPQTTFSKDPAYILHLQSQLYVFRSADLWKEEAVAKWLETTARWCGEVLEGRTSHGTPKELEGAQADRQWGEEIATGDGAYGAGVAPAGILRNVFVSDIPAMKAFLPPAIQQSTSYSFDPLPPPDGTSFDEAYFSLAAASRSSRRQGLGNQGGGGGRRGLAHDDLVAALHAGPAGLDALVERIRIALQADDGLDMDPEERAQALEQLQALIAMREQAPQGPGAGVGGFPGADEDDDVDEELVDEVPQAQGGFMNGLWGMFGRGAQ